MNEYFTLAAKPSGVDPSVVDAALRQAWNACADVACPKCGVQAWQYCRNLTGGSWWVTRFHRPRQDAAGAQQILARAQVHGLSWAKGNGVFAWDDRRISTL
uniref:zinc finger domain-containing protein n=1 Tax=Amycolatopsis sp. CA-096443 TaxID=3239919 RepID=UPI003F497A46